MVEGGGVCMSTPKVRDGGGSTELGEADANGVGGKQRAEAVFIAFEDFKVCGVIPRRGHREGFEHQLTKQGNETMCRAKSSFDGSKTLFVFVSHRWLSPGGAEGHPDDVEGSKHKLIVEAVEKLLQGKHMKAEDWGVALWIDFGCVDQDLENPAAELDELHEIIAQADVLLTPVHDPGHAEWEYPALWNDFYAEYKAVSFQEYWGRAWCVLEAMSGACMPVEGGVGRAEVFEEGAIKNAILGGRRNHIVYGTKESVSLRAPYFFPPLLHLNLEKYNPTTLALTSEKDRRTILRIAGGLRKHIKPLEVGYKGERTRFLRLKNGWGTYTYENGNVYEGLWEDGERHGRGTSRYANGNVYEGEYKDDKRNGRGTFRFADGDVYEGEYKDGKRHGRGTFRYASGPVYEGEFKDGKKHGRGTYRFANGDVYEGEFEMQLYHGMGKLTYADGRVEEGRFERGRFMG